MDCVNFTIKTGAVKDKAEKAKNNAEVEKESKEAPKREAEENKDEFSSDSDICTQDFIKYAKIKRMSASKYIDYWFDYSTMSLILIIRFDLLTSNS